MKENDNSIPFLKNISQACNEAFINRNHSMFETAMVLKSSKAFENLSRFLHSIPPSQQFDYLARNEELLKAIRKELFLLIQTDTLTFDDLHNLGLEISVIEKMKIELSELLQSDENVSDREKRKSEIEHDSHIHVEKMAKLDSFKSKNLAMNDSKDESFIFELTDEDDEKIVNTDLGMTMDQFIKRLHIANIEQQILNVSTVINAKKMLIEAVSASSNHKQEQLSFFSKEKALLEDRKNISSARILKYTELITAYRQKITHIISQISDLEKARLQLQANVERSDVEARDCIASREADEEKILDLNQKLTDLVSSIDTEKNILNDAQNKLDSAENEIIRLRKMLDLKLSGQEITIIQEVPRILPSIDVNVNIAFFNEYSPKFYQIATDLFFHNIWKLPIRNRWKEKVLKFIRETKNVMIMCEQETLKGECKNEKCLELHFAELKMSEEHFALQYILKCLDPSEKSIVKDQMNHILTRSADEYLSSFLQLPVVKSRLEKVINISHSIKDETKKSRQFITPVLHDWSIGKLDKARYKEVSRNDICDVDVWIAKSISALPPDTPSLPSNLLKESIVISLEGLQFKNNSKSEKFRSFFLDLLMGYTGDLDIIREMFQSAIDDIPDSLHLKWMFYIFEQDVNHKKKICIDLMNSAITSKDSLILFTCLIDFSFKTVQPVSNRIRDCLLIIHGKSNNLINIPISGEILRKNLDIQHYCIFVLITLYFQVFSTFPNDLEMLPPHTNVTVPKLFLIPWQSISKPPSEIILFCDEILQATLNYLQFHAKEENFHPSFLAIVRNRIDLLQKWLNVKPSEIVGLLNIYITDNPFDELFELKAKYLWKAGSLSEANAFLKKKNYMHSLGLEIQMQISKGGLKCISDFISRSGNSKRLESFIKNPSLFSTHIEIIISSLKNRDNYPTLKAKEIVLKELLMQKNPATKGFLWYLLIYIQVFLNKSDDNDILYGARKLIEESTNVYIYPFKSNHMIDNPKSIDINYDLLSELSSGLSLEQLEDFKKLFTEYHLNFPVKD